MKKVLLITGANGFVGKAVLRHLESDDSFQIHALYNSSKILTKSDNVVWHRVDLLDSLQTRILIQKVKPSHLLHLAWYINRTDYWVSEKNLEWVLASFHLINVFFNNLGKKVLVTGTCAEYDWSGIYCDEEKTPRNSKLTYGLAKNSLYNLLMAYACAYKKNIGWARLFFAYGPEEHPDRLLPKAITTLLQNKQFQLTDAHLLQDFMYIDDVAKALITIMESEVVGGINIGRGIPISQSQVINIIAKKLSREHLLSVKDDDRLRNQGAVAKTDRLIDQVGFKATIDIETGLDKYISWIKDKKF